MSLLLLAHAVAPSLRVNAACHPAKTYDEVEALCQVFAGTLDDPDDGSEEYKLAKTLRIIRSVAAGETRFGTVFGEENALLSAEFCGDFLFLAALGKCLSADAEEGVRVLLSYLTEWSQQTLDACVEVDVLEAQFDDDDSDDNEAHDEFDGFFGGQSHAQAEREERQLQLRQQADFLSAKIARSARILDFVETQKFANCAELCSKIAGIAAQLQQAHAPTSRVLFGNVLPRIGVCVEDLKEVSEWSQSHFVSLFAALTSSASESELKFAENAVLAHLDRVAPNKLSTSALAIVSTFLVEQEAWRQALPRCLEALQQNGEGIVMPLWRRYFAQVLQRSHRWTRSLFALAQRHRDLHIRKAVHAHFAEHLCALTSDWHLWYDVCVTMWLPLLDDSALYRGSERLQIAEALSTVFVGSAEVVPGIAVRTWRLMSQPTLRNPELLLALSRAVSAASTRCLWPLIQHDGREDEWLRVLAACVRRVQRESSGDFAPGLILALAESFRAFLPLAAALPATALVRTLRTLYECKFLLLQGREELRAEASKSFAELVRVSCEGEESEITLAEYTLRNWRVSLRADEGELDADIDADMFFWFAQFVRCVDESRDLAFDALAQCAALWRRAYASRHEKQRKLRMLHSALRFDALDVASCDEAQVEALLRLLANEWSDCDSTQYASVLSELQLRMESLCDFECLHAATHSDSDDALLRLLRNEISPLSALDATSRFGASLLQSAALGKLENSQEATSLELLAFAASASTSRPLLPRVFALVAKLRSLEISVASATPNFAEYAEALRKAVEVLRRDSGDEAFAAAASCLTIDVRCSKRSEAIDSSLSLWREIAAQRRDKAKFWTTLLPQIYLAFASLRNLEDEHIGRVADFVAEHASCDFLPLVDASSFATLQLAANAMTFALVERCDGRLLGQLLRAAVKLASIEREQQQGDQDVQNEARRWQFAAALARELLRDESVSSEFKTDVFSHCFDLIQEVSQRQLRNLPRQQLVVCAVVVGSALGSLGVPIRVDTQSHVRPTLTLTRVLIACLSLCGSLNLRGINVFDSSYSAEAIDETAAKTASAICADLLKWSTSNFAQLRTTAQFFLALLAPVCKSDGAFYLQLKQHWMANEDMRKMLERQLPQWRRFDALALSEPRLLAMAPPNVIDVSLNRPRVPVHYFSVPSKIVEDTERPASLQRVCASAYAEFSHILRRMVLKYDDAVPPRGVQVPGRSQTSDESEVISASRTVPSGSDLNFQRKIRPLATLQKLLQKQQRDGLQEAQAKRRGRDVTVVASLVEKVPNLAGLARTCEILDVSSLVLHDTSVVQTSDFQSVAVTAERWLNIQEVRREHLRHYLQKQRQNGARIVALEQTAESVSLECVELAQKNSQTPIVFVLGREKTGVPADLLPLVDVCVEIPQFGIIRSLNVHVSASILLWEHVRQCLMLPASNHETSSIESEQVSAEMATET